MKIGLTGTIGSGKSLVASMLEGLGAAVIDTDEIARHVVEPGTQGLEKIVSRWGSGVLDGDGKLDRKQLANIVFDDAGQLRELNGMLHPLIMRETAERIAGVPAGKVTVLVVPLLFESGFDAIVDRVWLVTADEQAIVDRIRMRDDATEDEARQRIAAQMLQSEKEKRAHLIIRNSGSVEETRKQVLEAWSKIEKN